MHRHRPLSMLSTLSPATPILIALLGLYALLLTACGGGGAGAAEDPDVPAAQTETQVQAQTQPPVQTESPSSDAANPCADDQLRIGELPALDAAWAETLDAAAAPARTWQPDAGFKRLDALCWFGEVLSWDVYHYSPDADAWFAFPENEEHPPFSLEAAVLDPAAVSFADLRNWLLATGYTDDDILATGVTIAASDTTLGSTDPSFAYAVTFGTTDPTTVTVNGTTGAVSQDEGLRTEDWENREPRTENRVPPPIRHPERHAKDLGGSPPSSSFPARTSRSGTSTKAINGQDPSFHSG